MNKDAFWVGVGMLVLPMFLVAFVVFIKLLVEAAINWLAVIAVICGVLYVGTAIVLILKGLNAKK